jgi:hypothetical protein
LGEFDFIITESIEQIPHNFDFFFAVGLDDGFNFFGVHHVLVVVVGSCAIVGEDGLPCCGV